jgi:hypothetical protein
MINLQSYFIQRRYFSELHPSLASKMEIRRFGSWLCSRVQVKICILFGPMEAGDPNPMYYSQTPKRRFRFRN